MADTKISALTDGVALLDTDRIPVARSPFGAGDNAYLTPNYLKKLGGADVAAPAAQTLSVANVVAGTSNTAGAALTIAGSRGTGTGVGGSIIFQVAPAGSTGSAQNALASVFTITSASKVVLFDGGIQTSGTYAGNNYGLNFYTGGGGLLNARFGVGGVDLGSALFIKWSAGTSLGGSPDVCLCRDAANVLGMRNQDSPTTAQTFRLYETWTDASNYSRIRIGGWGAGFAGILTEAAGSGTERSLFIQAGSSGGSIILTAAGVVQLGRNAATAWSISTTSHFLAAADNAQDIGAVASSRPRTLYLGTSAFIGVPTAALNTLTAGSVQIGKNGTVPLAIVSTEASGPTKGCALYIACDDNAALGNGDRIGGIFLAGSRVGGSIIDTASIICFTTQAWVNTSAYGSELRFLTTPDTTITPTLKLTIQQDGGLLQITTTVGALGSAATPGIRKVVTDSLAPAYGATVAGGGAVVTSVISDGTNWLVG